MSRFFLSGFKFIHASRLLVVGSVVLGLLLANQAHAQGGGQSSELPVRRHFDIQFIFPGIPDVVGLCLTGHPVSEVAVEGCVSSAIFLASGVVTFKYLPPLSVSPTQSGAIRNLNLGPGFGLRKVQGICFDSCPVAQMFADAVGTLEYVFWAKSGAGLKLQLDLGATFELSRLNSTDSGSQALSAQSSVIPLGRFSFGLAF
jgi:hypothetical protein